MVNKPMNLLKAAATVSGFTLLSRITGLVRDTLLARTFGAGDSMDAFFVAFRIPNLLRRLFAEGAFSQAFVPLLGRIKSEQGDDAAHTVIDAVAVILLWVLVVVSVVGVVAAPVLVWLLASGWAGSNPATFDTTVLLTRVMFPYIACMSLVAMASGVLNTWRHFVVPAFTPVLLNVSMIVAAWLLTPYFNPPILALGVGVMVGGFAQLAIQIPALKRLGVLPRLNISFKAAWRHEGTRAVLKNMAPALVGVGVAQIALLINTQIASHLSSGSVSWLSFADRLMEFPTALLGVALGTVLMPSLTKAAATNDAIAFNALLDWGLRLTCLLSLPAALALVLLAQPLVAVLFHYGKFSANDVAMTQAAVSTYALGLIGFSLIKILAPAFYAQQNVKTPVKIAIAVLIVGQIANVFTVPWLGHAGLALSISIGALLNAALLYWGLRRKVGGVSRYTAHAGWLKYAGQLLVALLGMAAWLWWSAAQFNWLSLQATPWLRVAYLVGVCGVGAGLYFALLAVCGVKLKAFARRV
jgi:putative peptidoglycan lipid II flippase